MARKLWALLIAIMVIALPERAAAEAARVKRGERILNTREKDGTERMDGFLGRHGLRNADLSALTGLEDNRGKVIVACGSTEFSTKQADDLRGKLDSANPYGGVVRLKGGVCRGFIPVSAPGTVLILPEGRGSLEGKISRLDTDLRLAQADLKVKEAERNAAETATARAQQNETNCNEARSREDRQILLQSQRLPNGLVWTLIGGLLFIAGGLGSGWARERRVSVKALREAAQLRVAQNSHRNLLDAALAKAENDWKQIGVREDAVKEKEALLLDREKSADQLEADLAERAKNLNDREKSIEADQRWFEEQQRRFKDEVEAFDQSLNPKREEAKRVGRLEGYEAGKAQSLQEEERAIRIAEAEAADIRSTAERDSVEIRAAAKQEAGEIIEQARQRAEQETLAPARAEAEALLAEARQQKILLLADQKTLEAERAILLDDQKKIESQKAEISEIQSCLTEREEKLEAKYRALLAKLEKKTRQASDLRQQAKAALKEALPAALEQAREIARQELAEEWAKLERARQELRETEEAVKSMAAASLASAPAAETPAAEPPAEPFSQAPSLRAPELTEEEPSPDKGRKRNTIPYRPESKAADQKVGSEETPMIEVTGEFFSTGDDLDGPAPSETEVREESPPEGSEALAADQAGNLSPPAGDLEAPPTRQEGRGQLAAPTELTAAENSPVIERRRIPPEPQVLADDFLDIEGTNKVHCNHCGAILLWEVKGRHKHVRCPACDQSPILTPQDYDQHLKERHGNDASLGDGLS